MRGTKALLLAALTLLVFQTVHAQRTSDRNLETCLSGKYPSLCKHDLLSPDEQVRVRAAEQRENLRVCLTGKYPSLCNHSQLTPEQAAAVRSAERAENLRICSTGQYPALCRHELLSAEDRASVRNAELAENLRTCMDGRYASLCERSVLTPEQAKQAAAAEARVSAATRHSRIPAASSSCYDSSITSPTPFMGNDGEVFKLADGSLWEVTSEYEYVHEHYPEVVVCPASGTLVVDGKTLNVQQLTGAHPLSSEKSHAAAAAGPIESRIDGEFSGWEGDTIFKLMNGQIWQQASYAYTFHNAYSPKVLIYRTGSVHKMKVDGVDGEIVVSRLK